MELKGAEERPSPKREARASLALLGPPLYPVSQFPGLMKEQNAKAEAITDLSEYLSILDSSVTYRRFVFQHGLLNR